MPSTTLPARSTASASAEPILVLPVHFTRVDNAMPDPIGGILHTDTFDDATARDVLANANEVWKPAGIQFGYAGLDTKTLADPTEIVVTPAKAAEELSKLKKQAGGARGRGARYLPDLAELEAAGEVLASEVLDKRIDSLGKDQIEVVVLPSGRSSSDHVAASFCVAEVTDFGVRNFVDYCREQFEMGEQRLVVYGYQVDDDAPHGRPPAGADVGRYGSVLGHEFGHFLGLNHQYEPMMNLMSSGRSNQLTREHIAVARATARRKLGLDEKLPDGTPGHEKVLGSIVTLDTSGPLQGVESPHSTLLMQIYDGFPPELQRLMASVDHLEIVSGMTGAAETTLRNGELVVRLNRDFIDRQLDPREFFSWKEQLNFEGAAPLPEQGKWKVGRPFPRIELDLAQGTEGYLEVLMMHELGHVLQIHQKVNRSWSKKFWTDAVTPKPGSGFINRERLLYYFARGQELPASEIAPTYRSLGESRFATAYAGCDSLEDFAETFTLYAIDRWRGGKFSVWISSRESIDLMAHFHSDKMAEKREFVDRLVRKLA